MLKTVQEIYRRARQMHEETYRDLQELRKAIPQNTMQENVDIVYALREAEQYLDDARKETKKVKDLSSQIVCAQWVKQSSGDNIETNYCVGIPSPKICAKLPNPDKQEERAEYETLMQWLGVDPQLWDYGEVLTENGQEDTKVIDIHWPGFQSLCNRMIAMGYQLPPGVNKDATYTLYNVQVRKRKGVLD